MTSVRLITFFLGNDYPTPSLSRYLIAAAVGFRLPPGIDERGVAFEHGVLLNCSLATAQPSDFYPSLRMGHLIFQFYPFDSSPEFSTPSSAPSPPLIQDFYTFRCVCSFPARLDRLLLLQDLYILLVLQVSEQLRICDHVISRNVILDNFTYFQLHHPQLLRCPHVAGRSTL